MGKLESVGIPVPSIEVKLVDVADAGYYANKTPSQGEIWIRGNSITKGYFKVGDDLKHQTLYPQHPADVLLVTA